jgi:hypothetical protein
MSGLQINRQAQDENSIVTTLESYLRDQAALFGVLNTLFDLRLSLISRDVTGSAVPVQLLDGFDALRRRL